MKEGWEIKKLGEVCEVISGRNQKKVENKNGLYPIYGSGGIIGYADDYICNSGTTIIGRKGSINNPIYVDCKFWNVDTAFGLQPKDVCNPRFLYFLCKSIDFTRYDRSVTIPSLVKTDLLKIEISIPLISEQTRIVEELDLLNEILDKKRQQLKELDALSQSIFYDLFGDISINGKGWGIDKIGNIYNLKAGKNIKASELSNEKNDLNYPCYGGNGIRGYIQKISHVGCYPIIGRQGALCGNVVLADGEFYATEHAVVVSNKKNITDAIWTCFALKYMNLNQYAQGVAQPGLSVNKLNTLDIPVPPITLQNEFADKIKSIERQKQLIKASIAETQTLLDSRMDYYFN